MRYGSVCSGIEAATAAWHSLGWTPAWFAEIDPFASAVLAHHYPGVRNLGDFTQIGAAAGPIDVLVGGTPCQSFSVAGLRGGLGDDRGNLALEFLRLAGRARPAWVVWENVPGVLSSTSHDAPDRRPPDIDLDGDDGPADGEEVVVVDEYESDETHAFACFLAGLQEFGYGFAYRVLDAQHFGVPQRRRRVFVVGHLGDWRRAAAVLFERGCLSGDTPPRREAGAGAAPGVGDGFTPSRFGGYQPGAGPLRADGGDLGGGSEVLIAHVPEVAFCLKSEAGRNESGSHVGQAWNTNYIAHTLRGRGFDASEDGTGRGTPLVSVIAPTLFASQGGASSGYHPVIPIDMRQASRGGTMTNNRPEGTSGGAPGTGIGEPGDPAPSLSLSHPPAIAYQCHGNNVGPMGTVRAGNQGITGGVPFVMAIQDGRAMDKAQNGLGVNGDGTAYTCDTTGAQSVATHSAVRRLTPRECERLQGFPDDWTLVPYRGRPAADGPRYRAVGNSMAVPVMRWIGERIQMIHDLAAGRGVAR